MVGLEAASESDMDRVNGDVPGGGVYSIPNGVKAISGAAIKPKCTLFYNPQRAVSLNYSINLGISEKD